MTRLTRSPRQTNKTIINRPKKDKVKRRKEEKTRIDMS